MGRFARAARTPLFRSVVRALRIASHSVQSGRPPAEIVGEQLSRRTMLKAAGVGALTFAAETTGVTGVFNAGYGGQITINKLAGEILAKAGTSTRVIHAAERAGDVKHSRASADKLLAAGWKPRFTLKEGLAATFAFFSTR